VYSNTASFLTPAQVKSTLVDTGDAIADGKVAITKPRVNLGAASALAFHMSEPYILI